MSRGSDRLWERAGVIIGLGACATIAQQIVHEWRLPGPSSVSLFFTGGFFFVYLFWFAYGLRFRRIGIWLPNAVAMILQLAFTALIVSKCCSPQIR